MSGFSSGIPYDYRASAGPISDFSPAAIRLPSMLPVYNVRLFGSPADGVADDGASWNAAAVAADGAGGGWVYVPAGSYVLTTPFTFGAATNVTLWLANGVTLTGSALPTVAGTNAIIDYRDGSLVLGNDPGSLAGYTIPMRLGAAASMWIQREDIGLVATHLNSDGSTFYPLILESVDAVIALASRREGDHGSGLDMLELLAGALVDRWFIGKNSSNASYGSGSSIIMEYTTTRDYHAAFSKRFEFTKYSQLFIGGNTIANLYSSAEAAGLIISKTGLANILIDTQARDAGIIIISGEPRIQLISDDGGSNAALLCLQAGNLATNKMWLVHHRGSGAANAFQIQYNTISAGAGSATGDVAAGATTYFSISIGGLVNVTTIDNGVDFTGQTSGAGAGAGTLTNAPSAGNPTHWLRVKINGANRLIPCWT